MLPGSSQPTGVRTSLWRAATLFRLGACGFCLVLILRDHDRYARPGLGLAVGAAIVVWTLVVGVIALRGWGNRQFVLADLLVVAGLTLLSLPVQTSEQAHGGMTTLTTVWAIGPALGAGIVAGWRGGLGAAIVQGAVSIVVRQGYDAGTLTNIVLLLLAAGSTGWLSQFGTRTERALAAATARQAAVEERERLARTIHDGVLQVLALVQRRGSELGGEAAELGRLAGEQEAALRALITRSAHEGEAAVGGREDLAARLATLRSPTVTVSVPAEPVLVDLARAVEVTAAVRAALDNVERHAGPGARAWILLEDEAGRLTVTIRDDGVGIAPGRLREAAAQGRLGLRSSVQGRVDALGGTVRLTSEPGEGTEIELRIPGEVG